jgi:hypothetical protein
MVGKEDVIVFGLLGVAVLFGLVILLAVLMLTRGKRGTGPTTGLARESGGASGSGLVCPFCAERIMRDAQVCSNCGRQLVSTS